MKTFYLKHDNEEQFLAALESSEISFDYIGVIYKPISDDQFEQLDGFHANILCDYLPESLDQFVITPPSNPNRVFFGI